MSFRRFTGIVLGLILLSACGGDLADADVLYPGALDLRLKSGDRLMQDSECQPIITWPEKNSYPGQFRCVLPDTETNTVPQQYYAGEIKSLGFEETGSVGPFLKFCRGNEYVVVGPETGPGEVITPEEYNKSPLVFYYDKKGCKQ